ncbi:Aste57867_11515 [Aphanomyces stellatus]|uniref:Aste57867_11515 protein n=1 Tax=Aphanomyces stellatus TaxID=120398 RepID=A0A485KV27_9STRA|nr:hypothetical protein As57867_011472 [Aphanomyces stellatus]VFT88376.1 Aste57867_11515 [Aphanomyces stellatus]
MPTSDRPSQPQEVTIPPAFHAEPSGLEPPMPLDYVQIDHSHIKPGHGPIYTTGPPVPAPALNALELLKQTVRCSGDRPFLGHRTVDAANGQALGFTWESYVRVYDRIQHLAGGLMHENLIKTTTDGDRPLSLYMKNSPEWVIAQYAAMHCGGFAVALYDTLGADSTQFILGHTLSPTVVCSSAELPHVFRVKPAVPTLKAVIVVDTLSKSDMATAANLGLQIYTMAHVEAIGAKYPVAEAALDPADIYCLIYTSGTTGDPKGVPISHRMVLVETVSGMERMGRGKGVGAYTQETVHLSYLPLAHCIEHTLHIAVLTCRGCIAFSQGDPLKLIDDLVAARPMFLVSVPRVLNKIYDRVVNGTLAAGGEKAFLFNLALQTKLANLKRGYREHAIFDKLFFGPIRKQLGLDRVCWLVSGAAPLSTDVLDFYRILMDCPVASGYGLSETSAGGAIDMVGNMSPGTVGPPLTCMDVKLVSVPDMGYNVTDTTHGNDDASAISVHGRGEVCLRGPTVFPGYYKAPHLSKDIFDDDGWFYTGDIGVWTANGCLQIVDRKKNLFKLSQGEYVSPEKIENALITSPLVAQIFVYGDSLHAVLVAIVVPEEAALLELAHSLGVSGTLAHVCANKQVVDAVVNALNGLGKKAKLHGFEMVKAIKLSPVPFSVDNQLLTPTMKLKRNDAKKAYKDAIDQLYQECGDALPGQRVHLKPSSQLSKI